MSTIFLTGATGFIGGHLLKALVTEGAKVRCLVRKTSSRRNLKGLPVEEVEADLRAPDLLREVMTGCDLVFHCAADYRLYARDKSELYDTNVEGTRNVLKIAAETGVRRVVYTSSVGALGLHPDGKPADETTPVTLK
ncbi:MAG: NAD-dependent epimerase/dehydratase family protein, partial [Thermoanaerobaculia bacterium]